MATLNEIKEAYYDEQGQIHNLSYWIFEHQTEPCCFGDCIPKDKVKQFIQLLKEEIKQGDLYRCVNCRSTLELVDKLAGKDLL